mmetsp:Transcript_4143/g.8925  ORF Transcript_4143/g.8925 Transcript_4143/m.8925 type:complete len:124 (+) Transcript_4143:181-552(+)
MLEELVGGAEVEIEDEVESEDEVGAEVGGEVREEVEREVEVAAEVEVGAKVEGSRSASFLGLALVRCPGTSRPSASISYTSSVRVVLGSGTAVVADTPFSANTLSLSRTSRAGAIQIGKRRCS